MNLKSIEYFLITVEEMNFTRAAGRLYQPAGAEQPYKPSGGGIRHTAFRTEAGAQPHAGGGRDVFLRQPYSGS